MSELAEKKRYVVDPQIADEALAELAEGLMLPEEHSAVIDALTFGLHESEKYLEVVKSGLVALKGQPINVLVPTILAQGFFMGMKYCEAREAKKISGEEEYREPETGCPHSASGGICVPCIRLDGPQKVREAAGHDPMAEMIAGHGKGCVCLECVREYTDRVVASAAAPPKPHIRRVGKILGGEKSTGGKTQ